MLIIIVALKMVTLSCTDDNGPMVIMVIMAIIMGHYGYTMVIIMVIIMVRMIIISPYSMEYTLW